MLNCTVLQNHRVPDVNILRVEKIKEEREKIRSLKSNNLRADFRITGKTEDNKVADQVTERNS